MPNLPTNNNDNKPSIVYKPSELLGIFTSYLSRQEVNSQVVFLRGIYLKNPRHDPKWAYRYDILRDENTQTEITIQMSEKLSEGLKDGNLVTVGGVLGRRAQNNCHIQLMLVVSRVDIVQDQVVDEDELKRIELRRKKVGFGFKNVDGALEQKLYTDGRHWPLLPGPRQPHQDPASPRTGTVRGHLRQRKPENKVNGFIPEFR